VVPSFLVCIVIGIAGLITTIVLHATLPSPPQRAGNLILTEAAFAFTILINAYILTMITRNEDYHHVIAYIVMGIIACVINIIALLRRANDESSRRYDQRWAVNGLLVAMIVLQIICVLTTLLLAIKSSDVND